MAAPYGNKNGSKQNRLVGDMLRRVAAQNPEKLRKACEAMLDKAVEGDVQAFNTLADRTDGKPIQATEMTLNKGNSAERLNDDELADIATSSSTGAAEQTEGKTPVH